MARSRLKKKMPAQGFPEEVRMQARLRSKGICEAGTQVCTGSAAHMHHRKLRRFKDHTLVNCLFVCSSCHQYIHANPLLSLQMGWLVNSWDEPVQIVPKKGETWEAHHRPRH